MRDDEQLIPDDALTVVDVLGADGVALIPPATVGRSTGCSPGTGRI